MSDVHVSSIPISNSAAEDHALSRALLERVAHAEVDHALRIWNPVPALALSHRDQLSPGADAAAAAAARAGFETIRRLSGGHAVVLGHGTLCIGYAQRAKLFDGTEARFERLARVLISAFHSFGVDAERGALPGEWCPGAWSIRSGGVKIAGLAQRAIKGAAWIEAVVELESDPDRLALLREVYAALDLQLDTNTLGSVTEVAQGPVGFDQFAETVRRQLVGAGD